MGRRSTWKEHYEVVRIISENSLATVYKVIHKSTGNVCALKEYETDRFAARSEMTYLKKAQCIPGVIRISETQTPELIASGVIVLEWCGGGTLSSLPPSAQKQHAPEIASFLVRTLGMLHSKCSTIHHDVKPENILVRTVPFQDEWLALCDFGLARPNEPSEVGRRGTPDFLAPELLKAPLEKATNKVDSWMMGITLYECIMQKTPFFHPDITTTYENILRKPVKVDKQLDVVPGFSKLIEAVLQKDQASRLSIEECSQLEVVKTLGQCPSQNAHSATKRLTPPNHIPRTTSGSAKDVSKNTRQNDCEESARPNKKKKRDKESLQ